LFGDTGQNTPTPGSCLMTPPPDVPTTSSIFHAFVLIKYIHNYSLFLDCRVCYTTLLFIMDVQLYVYDLSQGLARMMSQGLLGIHIDAVYHTSLVFGGVEYFYGAGVQTT